VYVTIHDPPLEPTIKYT